jgi:hypothetical protein
VLFTTVPLRRWLSPRARQMLWMLVFLRLAMPTLPGSPLSIFALFEQPALSQVATSSVVPVFPADAVPVDLAYVVPEQPMPASRMGTLRLVVCIVWLGGMTAFLGSAVFMTREFSRRLARTARPADSATLALFVRRACY